MNNHSQASEQAASSDSSLSRLVYFLFIVAVATYCCDAVISPDIFWSVTVGRWITFHHALPRTDLWTEVGTGITWYDSSWFFNLIISSAFRLGRLHGVMMVSIVATIMLIVVISLWYVFQARSVFFGTMIGLLVSCGICSSFQFSSTIVGLIFCVSQFWLLSRYNVQGEGAISDRAFWVLTLLIHVLYVNTDCSYFIAALLCSFFAYQAMAARVFWLYVWSWVLGSFCTPYFGSNLGWLAKQSLFTFNFFAFSGQPRFDFAFAFLICLLVLVLCVLFLRPVAIERRNVVLVSIVVVLGLGTPVLVPYSLILTGSLLSQAWGKDGPDSLGNVGVGILKLERKVEGFLRAVKPIGIGWIFVCLIIVNVNSLVRYPGEGGALPAPAVSFLKENPHLLPVAHSEVVGPYIIYRLSDELGVPQAKAAMDQRTCLLRPDLMTHNVSEFGTACSWELFLKAYKPVSILIHRVEPFCDQLLKDPNWRVVYPPSAMGDRGDQPLPFDWLLFERRSLNDVTSCNTIY